jgi:predicted amidohydrolase YtcJ
MNRLFLLAFCACLSLAAQTKADLVVLHGKVYTENPKQKWAEAVAIRDGKIVFVGTDKQIETYRGPSTQVIDAGGHLVLPGFTDAHVHFIGGSMAIQTVALDSAETVAEIQKRVKAFAAAHSDKKVITGYGWMYPVFGAAALPNKKILDEVVPDRPVVLSAYDHHTTWANSKALAMADINKATPNPLNGTIVRDPATGEATGALKESAGGLVERLVPRPSHMELLDALREGLREANRQGIVRVHSAGGDGEQVELFDELRRNGQLTVRFYMALFAPVPELTPAFLDKAEKLRRTHNDDWISGGAIKFYTDGVIESHTAAMLAPYSDDPKLSGQLNWPPDKFIKAVAELDKLGYQIFTHSIGDRGIRLSLDAYENAQKVNGTKDARYRVEHLEDPDPADIPRFGKLGVIASMQPLHAYPNADVLDVWARNVGPQRAQHAWPWHSIAASGGRLVRQRLAGGNHQSLAGHPESTDAPDRGRQSTRRLDPSGVHHLGTGYRWIHDRRSVRGQAGENGRIVGSREARGPDCALPRPFRHPSARSRKNRSFVHHSRRQGRVQIQGSRALVAGPYFTDRAWTIGDIALLKETHFTESKTRESRRETRTATEFLTQRLDR